MTIYPPDKRKKVSRRISQIYEVKTKRCKNIDPAKKIVKTVILWAQSCKTKFLAKTEIIVQDKDLDYYRPKNKFVQE